VIESTIDPVYRAKNDTLELNVDYDVTSALTFTSQTGYNRDFLWSSEDYNRFNTAPGAFAYTPPDPSYSGGYNTNPNVLGQIIPDPSGNGICVPNYGSCEGVGQYCDATTQGPDCHAYGIFCDPQLGCSNRLVAEDLNNEQSWQLSQEFRLASHLSGPFNFSVGGNYLHYETQENYYVFVNSLTLAAYSWQQGTSGVNVQTLPWVPGVSDNSNCIESFGNSLPNVPTNIGGAERAVCMYIDPNPLSSLDNKGHSYFLSQNPYSLNSYAGFGEAYYNVMPDLKLTGGLRWTDDQKHFTDIPSQLLVHGAGYPIIGVVDQGWKKFTGRFAANWTPKLDFTDQTLIYGSYSRGYKAGGANPPGATLLSFTGGDITNPIHPLTFEPEFVNAYELGSKNTLLDGALTLNGNFFFYDYTGYQISRIVDRTAINDNFDAKIKGAELEAIWEPTPGLRFRFAGGYEHTRINNGQSSIDLMDRTAGNPDWMVVKPFPTQASNCILPVSVVEAIILRNDGVPPDSGGLSGACQNAYSRGLDPAVAGVYGASWDGAADPSHNLVPGQPYYRDTRQTSPVYWGYPVAITGSFPNAGVNLTYPGFDPATAPNNGQGFAKDLSGHELPNSPPFTISMSGDYTMPLTPDWAGTFHVDYYWQDYSWARVFNDKPYDRLRGYTNVNIALILTSQAGWQVMGYVKNVFDVTDITGAFLNSDDSALTTNVFLTDPRLFGVRVTKNW
jgi:outer membrane receptor protein involved in Fe transport